MESEKVLGLIKIGEAKYQKLLFEKGEIFMQTLAHFQKLEDNVGRGDIYEGSEFIEQIRSLKFENHQTRIELSSESGNFKDANMIRINQESNWNVYSLIGISKLDIGKENFISESNTKLGEFFILIYNVKEFMLRISDKLNSLGLQSSWNWVNYYDEYKYEGSLNPFFKPNYFKYQNEVRVVTRNTNNLPLKFDIGNLSDIAMLFPIGEIKKLRQIDESIFEI